MLEMVPCGIKAQISDAADVNADTIRLFWSICRESFPIKTNLDVLPNNLHCMH